MLDRRRRDQTADIDAALTHGPASIFAFEPPDWRHFWGSAGEPDQLGGTIACNLAGPRRIRDGAARDHHLGFHAVSGRGEAFKSGGRVVKNVTGYDLSKLIAGSFGTLAAITELTVKVVPAPEATCTLDLPARGLGDDQARMAMAAALAGPNEVSGAAHLPKGVSQEDAAMTLLRLDGHAPSVAAGGDALATALAPFGRADTTEQEASLPLWRFLRDAMPFAPLKDSAIWHGLGGAGRGSGAGRLARASARRQAFLRLGRRIGVARGCRRRRTAAPTWRSAPRCPSRWRLTPRCCAAATRSAMRSPAVFETAGAAARRARRAGQDELRPEADSQSRPDVSGGGTP